MRIVLIFIVIAAQYMSAPATREIQADREVSNYESIDSIIDQLYKSLSGEAGSRDWAVFRDLHHETCRLVPIRSTPHGDISLSPVSVDEFVNSAKPFFETTDFYERELYRKVERFGNLAHVLSTYESTTVRASGEFIASGINSIQLVFEENRWWILHAIWQAESDSLRIPPKYLGDIGRTPDK